MFTFLPFSFIYFEPILKSHCLHMQLAGSEVTHSHMNDLQTTHYQSLLASSIEKLNADIHSKCQVTLLQKNMVVYPDTPLFQIMLQCLIGIPLAFLRAQQPILDICTDAPDSVLSIRQVRPWNAKGSVLHKINFSLATA